jgi:Chaperone of endosialidase
MKSRSCVIAGTLPLVILIASVSRAQSVKGTGTPGAIPVWIDSGTLGNSPLRQSGSDVNAIGNVNAAGSVNAAGFFAPNVVASRLVTAPLVSRHGFSLPATTDQTTGVIALGFSPFLHAFGDSNVFLGSNAGNFSLSGARNAALGGFALAELTSGADNTDAGTRALGADSGGEGNTALGSRALEFNSIENGNTAVGFVALSESTESQNTTAVGRGALGTLRGGSGNIALGYQSGVLTVVGDNNIYIGHPGTPGLPSESGVIRIGVVTNQVAAYVAGIYSTPVSGSLVAVRSDGKLGVIPSSTRFKQDIQNMGQASSALMRLRPVVFRYKPQYADGNPGLHYGLLAEEVANVYPNMVQYDRDGKPFTVLYNELPTLLLNELQKQQQVMEKQQMMMEQQQKEIERQRRKSEKQQQQLQRQGASLAIIQEQLATVMVRLAREQHNRSAGTRTLKAVADRF